MTIQEAAQTILAEAGHPLSSREIAKRALDRQMVLSSARDPIMSLAQTIEKNIRDGVYNHPKLVFVSTVDGRVVALPSWNGGANRNDRSTRSVTPSVDRPATMAHLSVRISSELFRDIELATQAGLAPGVDGTVEHLIRRGLAEERPRVQQALRSRLEKLGTA